MSRKITPEEASKFFLEKGLETLDTFIAADKPLKSKCLTCGSIVTPTLSNLRRWGGCKFCASKNNAAKKRTDFQEANQIMLDANLEPLVEFKNNKTPWKSKCLICGEIVSPTLKNVKLRNAACKKCAWVANGFNRRSPEFEVKKHFELIGLKPLVPYPGSHKGWKSECLNCGQVVSPSLNTVLRGSGCKYCAAPSLGSLLYLISHDEFHAFKIGRGNEARIAEHRRNGWSIIQTWDLGTTDSALSVERNVLKHLRNELELPAVLSRKQMRSTGATETFSRDSMSDLDAKKLVARFIRQFKS